MKPKIVLTDPFFEDIIRTELKPHARVRVALTEAKLFREIATADGLICRGVNRIDEKLLSHAPRLKAVANFAVGIDNIDLKACKRHGVRVTNTPDVLSRSTAELTLALLMAAARRIPEGEKLCRSRKFEGLNPKALLGIQLEGRTAVLVGRGRIGSETEKLFHGIGLKTIWITRADSKTSILHKLKRAQVLSLHFPLTPQTYHWLNAKRISFLPEDAVVINTTRGATVDEKALIRALKSHRIFAAGLDVYEHEPKIPMALRRLPNVVLLPHIGSATQVAREAMARLTITGVLGILGGKHPPNEVTC